MLVAKSLIIFISHDVGVVVKAVSHIGNRDIGGVINGYLLLN